MRAEATVRLRVRTDYFEHRSGGRALRRLLPAIGAAIVARERALSHAAILGIVLCAALAAPWLSG